MVSIGEGKEFSTTGKDGQLVLWNLKSLEESIQDLKIVWLLRIGQTKRLGVRFRWQTSLIS